VQKVVPGSPAAKAGIRGGNSQVTVDGSTIAVGGDLIVEVNGESVRASDDLQRVVGRAKPGDTVEFKVLRGESQKEIEVTLGTRPESAKR
jgi:S1-C subfamily serine protease